MTYKDGSWGEKAKVRSKKRKEYFRNYRKENTLRRYGITESDYKKMLEKQKGCCAICGNKESAASYNSKNGPQRLSIDHCHETGKVRGLLCFNCNRALGYFKDSTQIIQKALSYLDV